MNKKKILLGILIYLTLTSSISFAVDVSNPADHAYYSFVNDDLWGIGDTTHLNSSDITIYRPDLPSIPSYSIVDELYIKLNFKVDRITVTDSLIERISWVSTCTDEIDSPPRKQAFYGGVSSGFHNKEFQNNLILSYNYVDNRFNQNIGATNSVADLSCWEVSILGADDVESMDINITYHQRQPANLATSGLQNYYTADGYTSGTFTSGKGTLSVIDINHLDSEIDSSNVIGSKVSLTDKKSENLVVLIHGWNPQSSKNKFAPSIDCTPVNSTVPEDLECGWNLVNRNLINKVGDDWTIARYDWSEDADSGTIEWPIEISANEARDRSHVHGLRLGKIIEQINPKQVQLISHSAGTWMARRAADYLKSKLGASINLELTMLDPYVNDNDNFSSTDLDLESNFDLTDTWVLNLKNYYVIDLGTDGLGYTSGDYDNWINLQLDAFCNIGSCAGGISFNPTFMDDHSGPLYWYANTITNNASHGFGLSLPYSYSITKPTIETFTPTTQVISVNPTFKSYFSKNMQVSTLAGAISINGSVSGSHTVSGLNYIESEFAVSFSASGDFTPDETVTVQIKTSATDRNNNNLEGNNLTKVYQVEGSIIQPPPPPADAMVFFNETIADGTYFNGGDSFTKTWTLKNTGTNTWNSGYCLKHYNGDILSSNSSVCVSGPVATNQTYTFSIPMTAPASIATTKNYRDNWRLYSGNASFSSSIWADINVRGLAAPAFNSIYEVDAHQIQLSWSALSDTNFYRLYRSNSFSGTYTEIMAAAVSSYTDSGLNASTTYFYKIKGCFDSQPSTCSGLSSAASGTTFPEAGTIAETIQTYTVSSLAVQPADTTLLSATVYNPSGVATLNAFQFAFVLSDDLLLGAGDAILYQSPEFTLANLATQDFSYSYTIPDAMTVGNHNLLACVLYDPPGVDPVTSYCQSKVLVVSASPATAPPVPYKPTIDYTQGASQATVSWNFSSGGIYYRLFRATSAAGTYAEIYTGSGYSHVDNSISTGTSYYYKLKSCANSLENSCSALSAYSSITTSSASTNDFFVDRLELSQETNGEYTLEIRQQYSGTSTSFLHPLVGFYLSSDTSCDANPDHYLGEKQSGLSTNDTSDTEYLTFSMPAFTNTGTWYACAIADHTDIYNESNENNNSEYIAAVTEVAPPRLRPEILSTTRGLMEVTWDAVPGTLQYRVDRATSPNGPFIEGIYVGTGLSFNDGVSPTGDIPACQTFYYRLRSCNSGSDSATCSVSPVVSSYTLKYNSPQPTLTAVSDNKILIEWDSSDCADYFYLRRTRLSNNNSKYIYIDKSGLLLDVNGIASNEEYSYVIGHCESPEGFYNNGCSYGSPPVNITSLPIYPINNNWTQSSTQTNLMARYGSAIFNFKNKLWLISGKDGSIYKNDIWVSDDGENWDLILQNAPFSPRYLSLYGIINDRIYMIGGRVENGSYSKEIWSSGDGVNWTLETTNAPFTQRNHTQVINFNNKLWIIGGIEHTNIDGSLSGYLSDIWSSTDGVSWTLVTSNAPFGIRWRHQLFITDNKLILLGGIGKETADTSLPSNQSERIYKDIWSTTDGINWILEDGNTPFGARYHHGITKFNNKYWLFGGIKRVVYQESTNSVNQTWDTSFSTVIEDDIWNSTNGIHWSKVDEVTGIESAYHRFYTFNNNMFIKQRTSSYVMFANYGYIPTPPTGNVVISGTAIANSLITADTSGISDQYTIGEYTYQWYINGAKVDGEEGIDFDVGNLTVGTEILVRARYTNSNGDLQTLMSDSVFVTTNPIVVNFSSEIISTTYRVTPLSNTLLGYDASYSVIYSSSNTNVATVSGTDENAVINIIGLGTTTITALVTDSDNNQSSTSFTLTINQAEQQITFDAAQLSMDLVINENFQLAYHLFGNSSSQTVFSSSDSAILTVDSTGMVTLLSTGNATITVSNPGDVFYLPTSSSIDILVTENPALIVVFINGFE